MTQERYDWVVIGDHPAAILSGCVVAKLGGSVLIIPGKDSGLCRISKSGQLIDPETNFVPLVQSLTSGTQRGFWFELLRRLGHVEKDRFGVEESASELSEIRSPMDRLLFSPKLEPAILGLESSASLELEKYVREGFTLARADQMNRALSQYQKRKEVKLSKPHRWDRSRKQVIEEKLKRFGRGFSSWIGLPEAQLDGIDSYLECLSGSSYRGGITEFRKNLLALARRLGATVLADTVTKRIFVENGKIQSIQLSERGRVVRPTGAALGISSDAVLNQMVYSGKASSLLDKRAAMPTHWRFTLAVTVNREAIPHDQLKRVFWIEEKAPPLEIEISEASDYALPGTQSLVLFARVFLPLEQEMLSIKKQREVAVRMFRQISEIFPFLEYHVNRVFPDFRKSETDLMLEYSESSGFVSPELVPDNLRAGYRSGHPELGSVSGIEGLYRINQEARPSRGYLGPYDALIEGLAHFSARSRVISEVKLAELFKPESRASESRTVSP